MTDPSDHQNHIKQLKYRANHRGIKEMDLILGRFAQSKLDGLNEQEIQQLEALMSESDRDLLTWFTGEVPFPRKELEEIFTQIRNFSLEPVRND